MMTLWLFVLRLGTLYLHKRTESGANFNEVVQKQLCPRDCNCRMESQTEQTYNLAKKQEKPGSDC